MSRCQATQTKSLTIWLAPSDFYPSIGGVEELTLQLGMALQSRGHRVVVVTNRHPVSRLAHEVIEDLEIFRVRWPAASRHLDTVGSAVRDAAAVVPSLRSLPRPDVIHVVCASNQTLPLCAASRLWRIPLVLGTQGETVMDHTGLYQRSRLARFSFRQGARRAAALISCSEWTARQAALIAPGFGKALIVPNGVRLSDWRARALPDRPLIGAWGRHVPQKGFDLLLRAMEVVRASIPDAMLLLGGSGPESDTLRDSAGAGVRWLGPLGRSGVQGLLDEVRVVAVPSRVEPFGIVALEALASGRVLVHSGRGGLPEAAGSFGLQADPDDPELFGSALMSALMKPASEVPAEHLARFDWSELAGCYESVYCSVA